MQKKGLGIVHYFHTHYALSLLLTLSFLLQQGGTSFQTPWQDRHGLPRPRRPTLCACAARPWASRLLPSQPVWWVIFCVVGVALAIISMRSVKCNRICTYVHIALTTILAMGMSSSLYASFSLPPQNVEYFYSVLCLFLLPCPKSKNFSSL